MESESGVAMYVTGGMAASAPYLPAPPSRRVASKITGCGPPVTGGWLSDRRRLHLSRVRWQCGFDGRRSKPLARPGEHGSINVLVNNAGVRVTACSSDDARRLGRDDRNQPQLHVQRHLPWWWATWWKRAKRPHHQHFGQRRKEGRAAKPIFRQGGHALARWRWRRELTGEGRHGQHREPGLRRHEPSARMCAHKIVATIPVKRLGEPFRLDRVVGVS